MKNTFGNGLSLTVFGESHGEAVGVVLDGIAPGLAVCEESIRAALTRRRPCGAYSTGRIEDDNYRILSGVKNGLTTGAPLALIVENKNIKSEDYEGDFIPRPAHADYPAHVKYHGFEDRAGGGHFSGRVTAPIVAVCAIIEDALREKLGITIGTHILSLHGIYDEKMTGTKEEVEKLASLAFPVLSEAVGDRMKEEILRARESGDSVGGVLESAIVGVPAGLGEPWFDSVEGVLSHLLFSVGGIKGVSFGEGFALSEMLGSEANDPYTFEGGEVRTQKNANGGILGGLTNGMPVLVRCAVKPTPSIQRAQRSVNLDTMEETLLEVRGRHDGAIVHRVASVVNACLAFGIADLLVTRYGTDVLREGL